MEREYNNVNINGILRKCSNVTTQAASAPADLLVFGYGCKLFRDDAKAREIDHGKHLIPWMGDSNLKIDRYDVRGALYDLTPFEPPPGGYGNRLDYMSADEQRAEQLCEEERYLFLYKNETDFLSQQEETAKRVGQAQSDGYKEVEFNYDDFSKDAKKQNELEGASQFEGCEDVEEIFKLPVNFLVPPNIQLPATMKQHAIIEKTARFIASHGVQMEILLKAKQCNNAQFEFLAQNSTLNAYYKYVTNAIKNGIYPCEEREEEVNETGKSSEYGVAVTVEDSDSNRPAIIIPTVKYTPSANCAYTQLISKIKGVPLTSVLDEKFMKYNAETTATVETSNQSSSTQPQGENCSNMPTVLKPNKDIQVELLTASSTIQSLAQYYSSDEDGDSDDCTKEADSQEKSAIVPEPVLNFPVPTENLKNIIDKTATYVIKNGRQFEDTLRTKSVERFAFLLPDSKYYAYYMYKVTGDPDAASKEKKTRKAAAVAAALISKKRLNVEKTASPVSFSIKTKDECTTAPIQTVLSQEASDDDEESLALQKKTEGAENPRSMPEHVQKAIKLVERNLMARNVATAFSTKSLPANTSALSTSTAIVGKLHNSTNDERDNDSVTPLKNNKLKSSQLESERNAIYEMQQQNRHKELKKAEEKVKDKLAQIAREKLGGLLTKEKQLQMERKRKAEAFLNHIKGSASSKTSGSGSEQNENEQMPADNTVSDDSDCSVHSVPISYYGPDEKTDDEAQPTISYTALSTVDAPEQKIIVKSSKVIPTASNSDDDIEVIHETARPTLRIASLVKGYSREKYCSSRSGSRSYDDGKNLSKKRKYRDESSDSRSSSYSSNSDVSRSYRKKRSKSNKDSVRSPHLTKSYKSKTRDRSERNSHKRKKSSRSSHRDHDSPRNDHYDERHSSRHKDSSRKRDNKIYEQRRSHKYKERR